MRPEIIKARSSASQAGVFAWVADVDEDRVFLSVITLTELRYGIERMPRGRRRKWLEEEVPLLGTAHQDPSSRSPRKLSSRFLGITLIADC